MEILGGRSAKDVPDLGALKMSAEEKALRIKLGADQSLHEAGLLCFCGERIEGDGVKVVAVRVNEQDVGTAIQRATMHFHSEECPTYVEALAGLSEGVQAVAVVPVAPIHWLTADELADIVREQAERQAQSKPGVD